MKKSWIVSGLGLTVLSMVLAGSGAADPWVDPSKIEIPELGKINVPKPDRVELKNGMVVYLLENREFPVVDVQALIRVGSIYEPGDKVGLASITGQVMRSGGSTSIDGDALDERLEAMGASVEVGIGSTQGTATVSCLADNLDEGLQLLAEVLRRPAFPQEKIDLAKKQEKTAIASRNDEMFPILGRELAKLIYGADHPYARHTEYATIDAITRDDLVAFHKEYLHPDRMILTVYGDFQKGKVKKQLEKAFEGWAKSKNPLPPDPEVAPTAVSGLFVADKANMTNSAVVLGHEGMRMNHPDYPAMQLFHEIMGGGFSSRLFNEIRSRRGLAYATGSGSGAGMHHPGAQIFYALTQTDSTLVTLGYVKEEVEKALAAPVTDDELSRARDSILNSLVFSLSSKGAVLNRLAAYEFYGYPRDFLDSYQAAIRAATTDDLLQAAKRNVRYPDIAALIVGEKKNFSGDLTAAGNFVDLAIAIPDPAGEDIPDATPSSLVKGQELLSAVAEAVGGAALDGIEDMSVVESGNFSVQGMELQVTVTTSRRWPDCMRSEQKLPMGTMVQAVCGDQAWMDVMQGPTEMSGEMRAEFSKEQERDLLTLLRSHAGYTLQALAKPEAINGTPAQVVHVRSDNIKGWKLFIDPDSKHLLGMEFRDRSMTGSPVVARVLYEDYRNVGGVLWPHQRVISHDGEPLATLVATSVEVNSGVAEDAFKMP